MKFSSELHDIALYMNEGIKKGNLQQLLRKEWFNYLYITKCVYIF